MARTSTAAHGELHPDRRRRQHRGATPPRRPLVRKMRHRAHRKPALRAWRDARRPRGGHGGFGRHGLHRRRHHRRHGTHRVHGAHHRPWRPSRPPCSSSRASIARSCRRFIVARGVHRIHSLGECVGRRHAGGRRRLGRRRGRRRSLAPRPPPPPPPPPPPRASARAWAATTSARSRLRLCFAARCALASTVGFGVGRPLTMRAQSVRGRARGSCAAPADTASGSGASDPPRRCHCTPFCCRGAHNHLASSLEQPGAVASGGVDTADTPAVASACRTRRQTPRASSSARLSPPTSSASC